MLNFEHNLRSAGDYDIDARRRLPYDETEVQFLGPNSPKVDVEAQLHIRIDQGASFDPHTLNAFVSQLHSDNWEKQSEAARTLAALAPKSLEDTLLAFANDPQLKYFAPLALHNLNTPRSMSALADLLCKSKIGTSEHMDSAKCLARSGDAQWFPRLLEVAQKKPTIDNYVDDAAELGGAKMLPYLLTWMQSSDTDFTRPNAVEAMGYTGSREAIPELIELLKSPDLPVAQRARWGLRQLTHMTAGGDQAQEHPETQYSRWLQWWAADGSSAQVYKASECGEVRPLP